MLLTNEAKQGVRSKVGGAAFAAAGGVIAVALLGGTALAARGLVRDRTITMAEAQRLAAATPAGGIQVDLNERVLAQLNRHLGTPDGRARLKAGLSRMPLYRAMIERKLGAAGLPLDLLAVPMAEAFYRNDVMSPEPYRARGIWQFIEPTAIRYGLRVDRFVDQRLDPELETDAAIAYYRDLMAGADFRGDWRLALMSYNVGESKVGSLIQRHRTRDPWRLHELDGSLDNYLPNVMALILILRHSQLVE